MQNYYLPVFLEKHADNINKNKKKFLLRRTRFIMHYAL